MSPTSASPTVNSVHNLYERRFGFREQEEGEREGDNVLFGLPIVADHNKDRDHRQPVTRGVLTFGGLHHDFAPCG